MDTAVLPVPRSTALRLSPISFAPSPRLFVSPSPNCPAEFLPQHLNAELSSMAQVACPAAALAFAIGIDLFCRMSTAIVHLVPDAYWNAPRSMCAPSAGQTPEPICSPRWHALRPIGNKDSWRKNTPPALLAATPETKGAIWQSTHSICNLLRCRPPI